MNNEEMELWHAFIMTFLISRCLVSVIDSTPWREEINPSVSLHQSLYDFSNADIYAATFREVDTLYISFATKISTAFLVYPIDQLMIGNFRVWFFRYIGIFKKFCST